MRQASFKVLLRVLGILMARASRKNTWFRTQGIVNGALDGRVVITGNAALLLWFWGLTRIVIPYGRMRRGGTPVDGALTEPNPSSSVDGQIVREPIAHEIDPSWETAIAARATLTTVRSPAGEQRPMW